MKRWKSLFFAGGLLVMLVVLPTLAAQQSAGVTAEAIGTANLRATPDVNAALVGGIQAGTRYPIIGRSEFYPWLLLGDPANLRPIGWVFQDLVTVQGDLTLVPFSQAQVSANPSGTVTLASAPSIDTTPASAEAVSPPIPTATLTAQVVGRVIGEVNIRYGPGVDYPRIGYARAGETFEITAYHTQFPWLQIRYPDAPNGVGWVAKDLLEVTGDVLSLPAIASTNFNLPTLTPTLPVMQASAFLDATPVTLSPAFQALGSQLWNRVLEAGFEPETSRMGALFLMDLQTNEAITFGNDLAFSGMSINKIAILTALYGLLDAPPNANIAFDIGNMMVCSENSASNALLRLLGNGDEYRGAQVVTDFLRQLGLKNTYLVAPFLLPGVSTPQPVTAPTTRVDQTAANPDYSNQMTVDEMGWLLNSIYQCASYNSGPLLNRFAGRYTQTECRQMLHVMSDNNLGQPLLMSAGVPANIRVAHKHGWVDDTHGNAGIVFTPGGNYILVVVLHNPVWLDFTESFSLITEISRMVYNYYNPAAPLERARGSNIVEVKDCQLVGSPILDDLMKADFSGG